MFDIDNEIEIEDMPFCPFCDNQIADTDEKLIVDAHGLMGLAHKFCVTEAREPEIMDDNCPVKRMDELGNQVYNLSCYYQDDEDLSEKLDVVAITLWELAAVHAIRKHYVKVAHEQEEMIEDLSGILPLGEYGESQIKELATLLHTHGYRSPRTSK